MEGVTFGLQDGLRALQSAGSTVSCLSLVGGDIVSVCTVPNFKHVFSPEPAEQALLANRYEQFRQLYRG